MNTHTHFFPDIYYDVEIESSERETLRQNYARTPRHFDFLNIYIYIYIYIYYNMMVKILVCLYKIVLPYPGL